MPGSHSNKKRLTVACISHKYGRWWQADSSCCVGLRSPCAVFRGWTNGRPKARVNDDSRHGGCLALTITLSSGEYLTGLLARERGLEGLFTSPSSSPIRAGLRHDPSLDKSLASRLLFRGKETQLHWETFSKNEAELLRLEGGRANGHRPRQLARFASIRTCARVGRA